MIVLDTNVLSELIRPSPAIEVKNWLLEGTENQSLATTVITLYEIEYGLASLPDGKRRKELEKRFEALTSSSSRFEVLALEEKASRLAGRLSAARRVKGFHAQPADMMIAAITLLAGASLSTRNIKDFTGTGIEVINPWDLFN